MIYIRLLICAILWGSNVVLMKIFLKNVPFLFLCFLRVLVSCFSIYLLKLIKKEKHNQVNHGVLLISGFIGIYLNFIFTMMGMKNSLGNQSALVNALIPVFTILSSYFFLHQTVNKRDLLSIVLCVTGFIISIEKLHLGIIYMILGSLFYITSFIMLKKYQIKQSLTTLFYQLLYGLMFLLIHCLISQQFDVSILYSFSYFQLILFVLISGIGFAYIQYTYISSINKIGLNQTSFYLSLNPIVTCIESIVLFKEKLNSKSLIGFLLIIISIFIKNCIKSDIKDKL